jgi:hypothetical protein
MNKTLRLVLIFGVVVLLGVWLSKEAFTSPGTMVQLATSHVPTQEDYDFYRYEYPRIVRRDLIDMTGGDPGPLTPLDMPSPQGWMQKLNNILW